MDYIRSLWRDEFTRLNFVFEENGLLVKRAYEKTGVPFKFMVKAGAGHHPHGPEKAYIPDFYDFLNAF